MNWGLAQASKRQKSRPRAPQKASYAKSLSLSLLGKRWPHSLSSLSPQGGQLGQKVATSSICIECMQGLQRRAKFSFPPRISSYRAISEFNHSILSLTLDNLLHLTPLSYTPWKLLPCTVNSPLFSLIIPFIFLTYPMLPSPSNYPLPHPPRLSHAHIK